MTKATLSDEDIVCLALRRWDSPWKNNQQIMSLQARSNRVLYVGPPLGLREAIDGVGAPAKHPQILERVGDTLYIYHEPRLLARARVTRRFSQPFNWATERLRLTHVRWLARRLRFRAPILWVFDPMLVHALGTFREKLLIYHVIDNYDGYFPPTAMALRAAIVKNQERMLRRADVVFAVSETLYERCLEYNSNSFLIPNGVNYELFQAAMDNGEVPLDLRLIPRPIIGYAGVIAPLIDFSLLQRVTREYPEWSLVLVGPVELGMHRPKLDALLTRRNVYYLGAKCVEEVPNYIKCFDVGIIPYQVNELTAHSDSLKLYEYLACGRPVVSTDVASVRRFRPLVEIAVDAVEFGRCVKKSLSEAPHWAKVRIAVAREHSWQRRVEVMGEVIRQHLSRTGMIQNLRPTSPVSRKAPS